jgi:hypothetical protein
MLCDDLLGRKWAFGAFLEEIKGIKTNREAEKSGIRKMVEQAALSCAVASRQAYQEDRVSSVAWSTTCNSVEVIDSINSAIDVIINCLCIFSLTAQGRHLHGEDCWRQECMERLRKPKAVRTAEVLD